MRRHALTAGLLASVLAGVLVLLAVGVDLLPASGSREAEYIDPLFRLLFAIAMIIFAIVMTVLLYSVAVFRRRSGDDTDAAPIHGNAVLETIWTVIPFAIVVPLGIYGAVVFHALTRPVDSAQALEVRVTALQWGWEYEYPTLGVRTRELWLPVGQPVVLRLYSRDVIHSFWVPEFRVKMDAVPGMETTLRFTPVQVGEYRLLCAELCGVAHAYMVGRVAVVEAAQFAAWARLQATGEGGSP
jgi:cytochrome c oxidase subunit 2